LGDVLDAFTLPYFQRGVVEVLVLAVGAGVIGTWIVLRGLAFFAHAVGTATFPGLVLAEGLGVAATLGAAATAALVALGVGLLSRGEGRHDAITALVLVGALALGVLLASDVFAAAGNVEGLLFGSLLLVDGGDIALAAVAAAVAVALAVVLEQRWLVTGFDPGSARALGARSALPEGRAARRHRAARRSARSPTLGALLATALLVVPAATTRLVCRRLRSWQLATVALGALEGVGGLWLALEVNAPPGATIAVLAGAVFALTALSRLRPPRRGGAGMSILEAQDLAVGYGGEPALREVTFAVRAGERVAVLGPNGGGRPRCSGRCSGSWRRPTAASRSAGAARWSPRPSGPAWTSRSARWTSRSWARSPGCRGGGAPVARSAPPRRPRSAASGSPTGPRDVRRPLGRPAPAGARGPRARPGRTRAAARRAVHGTGCRERRPARGAHARARGRGACAADRHARRHPGRGLGPGAVPQRPPDRLRPAGHHAHPARPRGDLRRGHRRPRLPEHGHERAVLPAHHHHHAH
jgi:ABC-type Mn2+/Zn2+ transport system permease subunit